jgi:hypothetical protein
MRVDAAAASRKWPFAWGGGASNPAGVAYARAGLSAGGRDTLIGPWSSVISSTSSP